MAPTMWLRPCKRLCIAPLENKARSNQQSIRLIMEASSDEGKKYSRYTTNPGDTSQFADGQAAKTSLLNTHSNLLRPTDDSLGVIRNQQAEVLRNCT
jgi:hypothetical protein